MKRVGVPLRHISVCADDFGANEAASRAIVELAGRGAISAATCLVHAPFTARFARELELTLPRISIGLHLDLTEFAPRAVRAPLRHWLLQGFLLRSGDPAAVLTEIRNQLDRFERLFSRSPAFVDGHCHVHQIPGVREPLLQELSRRHGRRVAVRSTRARGTYGAKGWFIEHLGGRSLQALLERFALHTNADFAGAYDFRIGTGFGNRMSSWLRTLTDGGLIMCHPELPRRAGAPRTAREDEYCFLASREWCDVQAHCGVRLQTFAAN